MNNEDNKNEEMTAKDNMVDDTPVEVNPDEGTDKDVPHEAKSNEDNLKEAVEKAREEHQVMSEDEEQQAREKAEEIKEESKEKRFGKKNKKDKKDKKDEKIDELTDKLARQMAEFDNFRKRTDKEKSQMYAIGVKDVVEKILPVIDNFERGLDGTAEEEKDTPFVQGMSMVYKQLMTTLEDMGIKPIEAVGQAFNPDFHNAVMHVEDENLGENIVAEEFQKGYIYKDTVVRHSMVKVAN